jgi:hypothetical protein
MGSTTTGANSSGRDGIIPAGLHRLKLFAVIGFILLKQELVVEFFQSLDNGKLVDGKLVILWTCKIDLWRLERYVFHNKQ